VAWSPASQASWVAAAGMPRAAWYRPRLLLCPVPGMGWHWNAEQPPSAALSSLALLLPPLDSFLGPLWQGSLPQDRGRPEPGGWGTRQSCQVNTRSLRRCSIRLLVWPLLLFAQSQHTSRAPAEMGSPHGCTRCPEKLDAGLDLRGPPKSLFAAAAWAVATDMSLPSTFF